MRLTLLVWLLLLSPAFAEPPLANPPPWVVWPTQAAAPATPSPSPTEPAKLSQEEIYVIDCKEPAFLLDSPGGTVAITKETGPIRIRGRFVGGSGKHETRTFQGPTVFTIEAQAPGRVELIVVKVGAKGEADVQRRLIDVLTGPRPPPGPTPPIPPTPIQGLRVLFVYDRAKLAQLTPEQATIRTSTIIRDYLKTHAAKGADGITPEARFVSVGDDISEEPEAWRAIMTRPRQSVPWVVISNGQAWHEGPWAADVPSQLAILKKYGGE